MKRKAGISSRSASIRSTPMPSGPYTGSATLRDLRFPPGPGTIRMERVSSKNRGQGSLDAMRGGVRRMRIGSWSVIAGLGLLGIMAFLFWARTRLDREPTAEASEAYVHGDWERASLLAQQRLKQAPADPKALRLAFRSAGSPGPRPEGDRDLFPPRRNRQRAGGFPTDRPGPWSVRTDRAGNQGPRTALAAMPDDPETLNVLCRLYYQEARYYASEEAAIRLARHPDREARAS